MISGFINSAVPRILALVRPSPESHHSPAGAGDGGSEAPARLGYILCAHSDVNQVPYNMHGRGMHLLNPMDAVGWYDKTIV